MKLGRTGHFREVCTGLSNMRNCHADVIAKFLRESSSCGGRLGPECDVRCTRSRSCVGTTSDDAAFVGFVDDFLLRFIFGRALGALLALSFFLLDCEIL